MLIARVGPSWIHPVWNRLGVVMMLFWLLTPAAMTRGQPGFLTFPPILIEQAGTLVPISGTATIINPSPRSYLGYLDEQLYTGQVNGPVLITGMQLRLAIGNNWRLQSPGYSADTWPNIDFTMPDFRVTLGRATPPIAANGGLRDGMGNLLYGPLDSYYENRMQVRSGPLTIPAHSFVASGGSTGVHAWGPTIAFSTPYLYTPGETIVFRVQHGGISNAPEVVPALFSSRYDAINWVSAVWGTDPDATFPQFIAGTVHYVRWVTAPVPEPSSLGSLAVGGLLLRRRRA